MNIIVKEVSPSLFSATLDGDELCRSRQPLFATARVLSGRGVPPETELTMTHAGSTIVAMRATVGAAAKLRVEEGEHGPRFNTFKPFDASAVRHVTP